MDADQACSSGNPSSSSSAWTYHVFLSFRGKDTRHGFTRRLYEALLHAGIHTFLDDDEISKGQDISSELLKAIQLSKIFVVVFSTNYASSRWCLDELVNILNSKKYSGRIVLPIFYDVDPSIVRHQKGTFAEAFARHEERFGADFVRAQKWKEALTEAANLSGWSLQKVADGHEWKFIQKIVEEISIKLNHKYLSGAIYPIGIDYRVQDLNDLLNTGKEAVCIVGIWGMGGMGKTTIAKDLYNQKFHIYDGCSFITSVREISKHKGLICLQEQLLFDILGGKENLKISNVDRGINVIKDRLHSRKVLIVLDDVDKLDQLNALVRKRDSFGSGSIIIITTRDVHLLNVLEVDKIYMATKLDCDESLQLFSWHAFGEGHPKEDYIQLSESIVDYLGGIPLALQVLGSFLFDKRTIPEWESTLKKLKRIPDNQIQEQLKLSFDALEDDELKDVFLDIACFLIGMGEEDAVRILDGCGFSSKIAIHVLAHKCLLTIDERDSLTMHDLLRDMGREVVCKKFPKEVGKRSRLWRHDEVLDVLTKQVGTELVEGLTLNFSRLNVVPLKTEAFSKMQKLRLLQLNFAHLTGSYEHFSKELRWICLHGSPLKYLPPNFSLENVVHIDMSFSDLKQVWKETKVLKKLKVLNLTCCCNLTKTPDFRGLSSLEKLILDDCRSLVEVHQSIGNLQRLVFLSWEGCHSLRILPRSILELKSLQILNLSECLKLDDGKRSTVSFHSLILSLFSPEKLPNSMSLVSTSLSLSGLCSLRELILKDCMLLDDGLPNDLESLPSLQILNLSRNKFHCLPASISRLSKLEWLNLSDCTMLKSITELPANLISLTTSFCTGLISIPDLPANLRGFDGSGTSLETINVSNLRTKLMMFLSGCNRTIEIVGADKSDFASEIWIFAHDGTKFGKSVRQPVSGCDIFFLS